MLTRLVDDIPGELGVGGAALNQLAGLGIMDIGIEALVLQAVAGIIVLDILLALCVTCSQGMSMKLPFPALSRAFMIFFA